MELPYTRHKDRKRDEIVQILQIIKRNRRKPLCKAGSRVGAWTSNFYQDKTLVHYQTSDGKKFTRWVKTKRLRSEEEWIHLIANEIHGKHIQALKAMQDKPF